MVSRRWSNPTVTLTYMRAVYYMQADSEQAKFAQELHERIRREFPEVCKEKFGH